MTMSDDNLSMKEILYFLEDFQSYSDVEPELQYMIDHTYSVEVLISGVSGKYSPSLIRTKNFFNVEQIDIIYNDDHRLISLIIPKAQNDLINNAGLKICYEFLYRRS